MERRLTNSIAEAAVLARLLRFGFSLALVIHASSATAMDATDVLPVGINSPALRTGIVDGVDYRFLSNGSLMSQSDYHSVEFDTQSLVKIEPRIRDLVTALDQFGRANLGTALNLGVLRVETEPEIRYLAPLYAYGITESWTVGVGVPIVKYDNRLSFRQVGSNVAQVRASVGDVSSDLNSAFDQLSVNLATTAQNHLISKGYKPIVDRSETIVGDIQLASLYRFHDSREWTGLFKTIVTLPTGPGDDPDDLVDLGLYGQTAVEPLVLVNKTVLPWLTLAAKGSFRYVIPDHVVKRVPESSDDSLPNADRKENVRRQLGLGASVGVSATAKIHSRVSAGLGFEAAHKSEDRYEGERGWDYGLLSRDTETAEGRVKMGLMYTSTEAYLRKETAFPTMVAYEFSDTVRGMNVERQTIHELSVTLFF